MYVCTYVYIFLQTEKERAKLVCWFDRTSDLAWLINPQKIEVHNWEPYLIEIHDAIGGRMLSFLRKNSVPNMERAVNVNYADNRSIFGYNVNSFRTAYTTAVVERNEVETMITQALDRKIGRMIGLEVSNVGDPSLSASETLQVSAYAFGGKVAPHLDAVSWGSMSDPRNNLAKPYIFAVIY